MQLSIPIKFDVVNFSTEKINGDIVDCQLCHKNKEAYSWLPIGAEKVELGGHVYGMVCEECHFKNNGDEVVLYQEKRDNWQHARYLIEQDIKNSTWTGSRVILREITKLN